MIEHTIAREVLARHGIAAIWDFHVAAAAAYGVGNRAVAQSLIEIAEAAEEEWLHRRETVADTGL